MPPSAKRHKTANDVSDADAQSVSLIASKKPAGKNPSDTLDDGIAKRRTLFVRGLPYSVTSSQLSEKFSFIAPIKHATVVVDRQTQQSRGFGFVTFTDAAEAERAMKELNGKDFDGRRIKVDLADLRHRQGGGQDILSASKSNVEPDHDVKKRSPRLIVRNLAWTVKRPEQLSKVFQSFGKVKEIIIPKKGTGEMCGFAFVTMKGYKNAERAMQAVNGKEIDGRTVAVDWAIEKKDYKALQENIEAEDGRGGPDIKVESDEEDGDDAGIGSDIEASGAYSEDEDAKDVESDEHWEDDEDVDGDMDEDEKPPLTDSSTMIFLRNLPYTTNDDLLYEHFKRHFGRIHYARVVYDHTTGKPRGTGFVAFYNGDDATECLSSAPKTLGAVVDPEAVDPSGKYTLDGRVLSLTRAVDRNEAERLQTASAADHEKKGEDKRRLFLLREGTIASNSPAYKNLSPKDVQMRQASYDQRRKLLSVDTNLHLSLTRLSVRNLPRWMTSTDLKTIARKAIPGFAEDLNSGLRQALTKEEMNRDGGEGKNAEKARREKGKGVVKQAKVQLEKEGGRSRGWGFVEYFSHRNALMGLRYMNGQETESKGECGKKRLIVEFAIENRQVVARRKENEKVAREGGKAPALEKKPGKIEKLGKRKREDEGKERNEKMPTLKGNAKMGQRSTFKKQKKDAAAGKPKIPSGEKEDVKLRGVIMKKRMARRANRKCEKA